MNSCFSNKRVLITALLVIGSLTTARLYRGHFDASYFIVAGSDFVDSEKTPAPVIVQKGQGYDGQFFYRYALRPFDFKKNDCGVNVDLVPYRIQRIAYPLLVWFFSMGGKPLLVPWMLVFVNILAFLGIFFFTYRFIVLVKGHPEQVYLPLLLCGIYMSFARDLSEVVELFFFIGTIYFLFKSNYFLLSVFATLAVFTRETAIIGIFPILIFLSFRCFKEESSPVRLIYLALPLLIFGLWKWVIHNQVPDTDISNGYTKIGFPFAGMFGGLQSNFNFSDNKHVLEFLFWVAYFLWNIFLAVIVLGSIQFKTLTKKDNLTILNIIYIVWTLFAICFSATIYCDDWGFLRIFSLWNMVGFLIIIANNKPVSKSFNIISVLLVVLTVVRLIVRV